ncbi:MAG: glycoside hydrolase family 1 protein [Aerococcus sp.]|nr:glycoside hydrolase family 1 protein [Aerococcus sp.]
MKTYTFPKHFFWGSATSAPQSEGRTKTDGKGDNLWDHWFKEEPERFFNNVGPTEASGFYTHYQEDIALLKATGQTAFRTSIQWSRLFPLGRGMINEKGIAFYRDVFTRIKAEGLHLIVNLYHFDLPYALQEEGGWVNKQIVDDYVNYATACFNNFGDLVDDWATFNEPIVPIELGYLGQDHLPGVIAPREAVLVGYHVQLASARAIQVYHQKGLPGKIGIILNLTPAYPRSDSAADRKAAYYANLFQSRCFLDPSVLGHYPDELVETLRQEDLLPATTASELEEIAQNTVDFLGVNYYQPLRVQAPKNSRSKCDVWTPNVYYDLYHWPKAVMNPYRGWEIYPQALYDIAINIRDHYHNIDWFVAENGMGVEGEERFIQGGVIQDDYRIAFIKDHLKMLHRGIEAGANCHGYMLWTFIDCWSWTNAYKNRYGLVRLDLATGQRTVKKSGHWFRQLSKQNGFSEE